MFCCLACICWSYFPRDCSPVQSVCRHSVAFENIQVKARLPSFEGWWICFQGWSYDPCKLVKGTPWMAGRCVDQTHSLSAKSDVSLATFLTPPQQSPWPPVYQVFLYSQILLFIRLISLRLVWLIGGLWFLKSLLLETHSRTAFHLTSECKNG